MDGETLIPSMRFRCLKEVGDGGHCTTTLQQVYDKPAGGGY